MASILKVEIKKIVTFRGHEGEPLNQGTFYLDRKPVGDFSEGDWGGPMRVNLPPEALKEIAKRGREYFSKNQSATDKMYPLYRNLLANKEKSDMDIVEELISELLLLKDTEKTYKQNLKKGFTFYVEYVGRDDFNKGIARGMCYRNPDDGEAFVKQLENDGSIVLRVVRNMGDLNIE